MYRCANCNDVVGPYVSKSANTRVTETRSKTIFIPRFRSAPLIKRVKEIAKESAFCKECTKDWDNNHPPEPKPKPNNNVTRLYK